MTKQELNPRILKNGKPLSPELFVWDEEKNTFKTKEPFLTIDFSDLHDMTVEIGDASTLVIWNNSTIVCGTLCTIICGLGSQVMCGVDCNIDAGLGSKIKAAIGTMIISRDSTAFARVVANTGSEVIDEASLGENVIIPYLITEEEINNEPVQFTTKIKIAGKLVEVTAEQLAKISEIIKL